MTFTIRDLMTDPALFGAEFGGESWAYWRALLCGFYGLELTAEESEAWHKLTKRSDPEAPHDELWLVMGRRGGKSRMAALLALYESCFRDHSANLSPGEVATIRFMAVDRDQARAVMRYTNGLIDINPMIRRMVTRRSKQFIELCNRTVIEIGTASFRGTRGYTYACVICDEIAQWRSDESANPDTEILSAVRPGLMTLKGKLIALSSPYGRRGELWDTYDRYMGADSPVLVAHATSQTMNPMLPDSAIEREMERDPSRAKAEYLAEFRNELEQLLSREVVEGSARRSPLEYPYSRSIKYYGFVDPAGGGEDEFCLCIGHKDGDRRIVDLVRAMKGKPSSIVAEYAGVLKSYNIFTVTGDRYAGSWPADEFRKNGIQYLTSKKPKNELYLDLLPALNSGRVELPPDEFLINQLIDLERRTSRAGRDSIDHPKGGHDDRANVVAGAISRMAVELFPTAVFGTYGCRVETRNSLAGTYGNK